MNAPQPIQQPLLPPAPWYTSEVQVRAVIAILGQLVSLVFRTLPMVGIDIDTSGFDLDAVVANVSQGVAIVFAGLAIMKRQQSIVAPLTMTQAGAEQLRTATPPLLDVDPINLSNVTKQPPPTNGT